MPLRHAGLSRHDAGDKAALTGALAAMSTLHWHAEDLWLALEPLCPGLTIEILPRCESTNTLLVERARGAEFAPTLLVAQEQTRGRGRQGRAWASAPGVSLTFSLALPLAPPDWQGLSLAVGVALADALDPDHGHLGLKWPNDLWLRDVDGIGRKLGGILIETVNDGERRVAVIGIGLNIAPLPQAAFDTGFACLQEIDAQVTPPQALARLAAPLLRALRRFEAAGFAAFAEDFARRDLLRGRHVSAAAAGIDDGVAEGVDARGALLVRDGRVHALVSGEVSVRPLPAGAGSA